MNKKALIIFLVGFLGLTLAIYQYAKEFQLDWASAYTSSKPANGHSWTEMECTSNLCVTGSGVGVGTDSVGSNKLKVVGNVGVDGVVNVTSNVCISGGSCLSDIAGFIGSQAIAGGTTHNRANCTATNSINGVTKGVLVTEVGIANPICRFEGASCPSGWNPYNNYITTGVGTCTPCSDCTGACGNPTSTTPQAWGSQAPATTSCCATVAFPGDCHYSCTNATPYCVGGCQCRCLDSYGGACSKQCTSSTTVTAPITQIGCF